MSILRNFERRLESVVEGAFAKTFRSGLQPVELAKRVIRDQEAGRSVGVRGEVCVPNRFLLALSQADQARFQGAEHALVQELARVVRENARERGWTLMGPPEIAFETDTHLKKGVFRCQATMVEGVDTGPEASGVLGETPAQLILIQGDRHGRSYPLAETVTVLGRLQECEVVLTDLAASRKHAEILNSGGSFALRDLGSTNGTSVNGARTTEQPLEDGDRITIGNTTFEFRRA